MSKTFKSQTSSDIVTVSQSDLGALIEVAGDGEARKAISVSAKTAPAFTLAILEAAGWPEEAKSSVTHSILRDLRFVVAATERMAQEAAERAQWEAEALHLCNAHRYSAGLVGWGSFDDLNVSQQRDWLGVAHQARELHGGTK